MAGAVMLEVVYIPCIQGFLAEVTERALPGRCGARDRQKFVGMVVAVARDRSRSACEPVCVSRQLD